MCTPSTMHSLSQRFDYVCAPLNCPAACYVTFGCYVMLCFNAMREVLLTETSCLCAMLVCYEMLCHNERKTM